MAKGYQLRKFPSQPLPGTIDIREHLSRYAARPDKLITVARRLSSDIDRNRALATATAVLLRMPLQSLARIRLRRVGAALSAVSTPPMSPRAVEQLIGQPRQGRYDNALLLCAVGQGTATEREAGRAGDGRPYGRPSRWTSGSSNERSSQYSNNRSSSSVDALPMGTAEWAERAARSARLGEAS